MSIAFSRSMRSLNADSFRPSFISLAMAIILLVAWLAWFFLGRVGFYETSQNIEATQEGTVVAYFPLDAQERIFPGQVAYLRFDGAGGETDVIPVTVFDIIAQPDQLRVQVELIPLADPTMPIVVPTEATSQVEIEIDRVSPATLVLQTAGDLSGQ